MTGAKGVRPPSTSRGARSPNDLGISSAVVAPVLQALRDLGLQLPVTSSPDEGNVPGVNADALLNRAAAALNDPALGISAAQRIPMGALGPLDYGLVTAASLREGLARTARYYGVVTERVRLAFLEEPPRAIVDFQRGEGIDFSRHWLEFALAMIAQRIRQAIGPGFALEAVSFAHAAPDDQTKHDAFFGVKVQFDAPRDQLVLSSAWLDRPLRTAAASLANVLETTLAALESPDATDDPFLTRVRQALGALLDERETALPAVAAKMAISRRTLQRELQRRGTSHQAVLDELRRERAIRLLEDEKNTVASVAAALGFAEPSAFFRAFRRWTGSSPSAIRPPR